MEPDRQAAADSVEVEVKGPDPAIWGEIEAQQAQAAQGEGQAHPGLNEIWNEGTEEEVKGPSSSEWKLDEAGNLIPIT